MLIVFSHFCYTSLALFCLYILSTIKLSLFCWSSYILSPWAQHSQFVYLTSHVVLVNYQFFSSHIILSNDCLCLWIMLFQPPVFVNKDCLLVWNRHVANTYIDAHILLRTCRHKDANTEIIQSKDTMFRLSFFILCQCEYLWKERQFDSSWAMQGNTCFRNTEIISHRLTVCRNRC